MSEESPASSSQIEQPSFEQSPSRPAKLIEFPVALVVLVILALAAVGYSFHEHSVAKQLAASNSTMSAALNSTRDQLNSLSAKVSAMDAKPSPDAEMKPAEMKPAAHIYRKPLTAAVSRHRMEDPRWKKMQGQLDAQGQQIESTRQDLASTRTELNGSIAKTHDELVLLEKKGERNYFEFDLDKADQFQHHGPVSIRLRKANTKHDYADLELMVDDAKVSKKHVNVFEPVVFYPADEKLPVEIVINSVTRNHIHGYVSEPKYRSADLQAMANSGADGQAASASDQSNSDSKPSPARQRLELPADASSH
jgi:hypothetical protein